MPPSSDSISSTSLPFGIDNHVHASLRRSGSLPRSMHQVYQSPVYSQDAQKYSTLVANAHASNVASRSANPHIPPSSIHTIPTSHKKFLRQHRILFWILIGVFNISLIALTAGIVLGVSQAHEHGQNGAKCAAIIVGVFGFSGALGSSAVIWYILTGRRARTRLEKRWADEERVKEARGMRERQREAHILESIKDRERSLSRSCSRGRARERIATPAVAKKPSYRAMTPAPQPSSRMSDQSFISLEKMDSVWPRPLNISKDNLEAIVNPTDKKNHKHNDSRDRDKDQDAYHDDHHEESKARITPTMRDSVSTQFDDLEPSDSETDENQKIDNGSRLMIATLNEEPPSKVSQHLNESTNLPPLPEYNTASPTPLNTSSTYIGSWPTDPYPNPLVPSNTPRLHPSDHTSCNTALPHSNNSHTETPHHDDDENANSTSSASTIIPRLNHGGLGSAQSDENFLSMLFHNEDATLGSEADDDDDYKEARRIKRKAIKKRVEAWASTTSLADVEEEEKERGRGRERERGKIREDRGIKLREAVERGKKRVESRKRERREGGVVVVGLGRGNGIGDGEGVVRYNESEYEQGSGRKRERSVTSVLESYGF